MTERPDTDATAPDEEEKPTPIRVLPGRRFQAARRVPPDRPRVVPRSPSVPGSRTGPPAPVVAQPPMAPPAPPGAAVAPGPRRDRPFARGFGLGSGAGLGAGLVLLVGSLIGSLVMGAVVLAGMGAAGTALAGSGQMSVEPLVTLWGSDTATKNLRAIPVTGTIMADASDGLMLGAGTYGYEVSDVLDSLGEETDGVLLLMNTPGGSISGSRAMADAIDRYRDRTGNPVFAYVQGMSASGGMYTMAGADEILADHGSLIGSVGVIMGPIAQYTDVVATDGGLFGGGVTTTGGITEEYLTAGRGKDAGNPYRPLTDEERANFQEMLDDEYAEFVTQVATKRGIEESVIVDEVGAGILGTERATEVGYIDGVMGRDEAFTHFAEAAGLDPDDTRISQSSAPAGLWWLLGVEARPWGEALAAEPVDGQPARATSTLCTGARVPVAWYGPTSGYCS